MRIFQSMILLMAMFAAFGFSASASAQNRGGSETRIKCESWDYRPTTCPIPGGATVRLDRVIAGDCNQANWSQRPNAIFVRNGCRAIFAYFADDYYDDRPGYGGGRPGYGYGRPAIVRCESWQYRPARCAAQTSGGVTLSRVIAGDCRQGQTWGWDRAGIWVNGGCRADFAVRTGYAGGNGPGYPGGGYPGTPPGTIIKCESWDYRPARCPISIYQGAAIERVEGGSCIEGRTWGWDRNSIWVNGGCRARFRVY